MSARTVELIGGPLDGERVTVDGPELRIPIMHLRSALFESEPGPVTALRVGIYRTVGGDQQVMHWQGEL